VSLLVVSEQCVRALLVEKKMQQLLPAFFDSANEGNNGELESRATDRKSEWELRATEKKSDRLLVLSAGLRNLPGAAVPKSLLIAAAERGIDLTDDNPRAAFDAEDLEYFDFILCVDGEVRDKLLQMAALRAGGSDRVADPDVFSASSFVPSSASASASSSSSLTERLSYEEYERKIILAGSYAGLEGFEESKIVEVPKMPDIELLHPAVLEKHLPQVLQQVDKVCYSTLEFLARLGL